MFFIEYLYQECLFTKSQRNVIKINEVLLNNSRRSSPLPEMYLNFILFQTNKKNYVFLKLQEKDLCYARHSGLSPAVCIVLECNKCLKSMLVFIIIRNISILHLAVYSFLYLWWKGASAELSTWPYFSFGLYTLYIRWKSAKSKTRKNSFSTVSPFIFHIFFNKIKSPQNLLLTFI